MRCSCAAAAAALAASSDADGCRDGSENGATKKWFGGGEDDKVALLSPEADAVIPATPTDDEVAATAAASAGAANAAVSPQSAATAPGENARGLAKRAIHKAKRQNATAREAAIRASGVAPLLAAAFRRVRAASAAEGG